MAITWPAKNNYATGDVLTATNMNGIGDDLNALFDNSFYAGKNKIINGAFDWNQRSFTSTTTSGTYGFDRWRFVTVDGTVTYSAQTFTAGTAPVSGYEATNYARIATTGQTLATAVSALDQRIENVRTFAGQTITVSFWAKAATSTPKVAVEVIQNFGTGGSPTADINTYAGQVTLSTSWARYSVTVAVPSISGKSIGTTANTSFLGIRLFVSAGSDYNSRTGSIGIQTNTFDIWGVQAESGTTATPFQTATGTIQGELAACQRYYQKSYAQGTTVPSNTTTAGLISFTTTSAANLAVYGYVPFKVTMRTAPSVTTYSYTSSTSSVISNTSGVDQGAGSGYPAYVNDAGFTIYNNSGGTVTTTGGALIHFSASAEL